MFISLVTPLCVVWFIVLCVVSALDEDNALAGGYSDEFSC